MASDRPRFRRPHLVRRRRFVQPDWLAGAVSAEEVVSTPRSPRSPHERHTALHPPVRHRRRLVGRPTRAPLRTRDRGRLTRGGAFRQLGRAGLPLPQGLRTHLRVGRDQGGSARVDGVVRRGPAPHAEHRDGPASRVRRSLRHRRRGARGRPQVAHDEGHTPTSCYGRRRTATRSIFSPPCSPARGATSTSRRRCGRRDHPPIRDTKIGSRCTPRPSSPRRRSG